MQRINIIDEMRVLGIVIRHKSRGEMVNLEEAEVSAKSGVENDFRGSPGKRQVTVLFEDSWINACSTIDKYLFWTVRRANLYLSGSTPENSVGSRIKIGKLILEITGELTPCERMDEQEQGLTNALFPDWRGGVLCSVIAGGRINIGDEVVVT